MGMPLTFWKLHWSIMVGNGKEGANFPHVVCISHLVCARCSLLIRDQEWLPICRKQNIPVLHSWGDTAGVMCRMLGEENTRPRSFFKMLWFWFHISALNLPPFLVVPWIDGCGSVKWGREILLLHWQLRGAWRKNAYFRGPPVGTWPISLVWWKAMFLWESSHLLMLYKMWGNQKQLFPISWALCTCLSLSTGLLGGCKFVWA